MAPEAPLGDRSFQLHGFTPVILRNVFLDLAFTNNSNKAMASGSVLEIVHYALRPSSSSSSLPPPLAGAWRQICVHASTASGRPFHLYRSVENSEDFFFVGGWDDIDDHAKTVGEQKASDLKETLQKYMELVSIRHIRADVQIFDLLQSCEMWEYLTILEKEIDSNSEENGFGAEQETTTVSGWDVSQGMRDRYQVFENISEALGNGGREFPPDKEVFVTVDFGSNISREQEKEYDKITRLRVVLDGIHAEEGPLQASDGTEVPIGGSA